VTDKNNDEWEEIFESIDMDFLPLEYINTVIVTFRDGKVWEIDLDKTKTKLTETVDVEETLGDFFEQYEKDIEHVDFRIDTDSIKRDVGKRTRRFLKLNK